MIVAIEVLKHALIITLFVFVMMVLIDYVNVMTRGQLSLTVRGGRWRPELLRDIGNKFGFWSVEFDEL